MRVTKRSMTGISSFTTDNDGESLANASIGCLSVNSPGFPRSLLPFAGKRRRLVAAGKSVECYECP